MCSSVSECTVRSANRASPEVSSCTSILLYIDDKQVLSTLTIRCDCLTTNRVFFGDLHLGICVQYVCSAVFVFYGFGLFLVFMMHSDADAFTVHSAVRSLCALLLQATSWLTSGRCTVHRCCGAARAAAASSALTARMPCATLARRTATSSCTTTTRRPEPVRSTSSFSSCSRVPPWPRPQPRPQRHGRWHNERA